MAEIPILRIFVSSPGDVAQERSLAGRVIDRLEQEFSGQALLEAVFWEHEPLVATSTFQDQIVNPSDCDIVVCILWSRLGTRLPAQYTRDDGSRYESGTEYEFEDAARAFADVGRPDLLVYRKTAQPLVSLSDGDALIERLKQRQALDVFVNRWFHNREDGTLRAAFHPFEEPGGFEDLLEAHLRKLIRPLLPKGATPVRPQRADPRWKQGSPFRGLQAFDTQHADIFFGRTTEVSEVIAALQRQAKEERPFVLIVGGSGSGKSSLARAGVLPMLTEPGVVEGVATWRRAVFRPGDEDTLFAGLANALTREGAIPELIDSGLTVQDLGDLLRNAPAAVPPLIRASLRMIQEREHGRAAPDGVHPPLLALLVDQLEELFTHGGISEDDRTRFATAVDHLVRGGDVWTLATLRSDVYPRLSEVPLLVTLKEGAGQYDLRSPQAANIGQMIRQPVLAAGLSLEENAQTGERLEDLLRDPVVRRPSVLPLLEFTLEQLYEARSDDGMLTLAAFHELGGVEGSLGRRAEEAFLNLPPEAQKELPRAMRSLVTVAEGDEGAAIGSRRAPMAELAASPATQQFVDALISARLLVTDLAEDGSAVVRLAHEALLRHWPRLQEWIEQDRELLKARARLRAAAFRWAEEGRAKDLLLPSGKPLAEADEVVQGETSLTELEQDFLDRSRWAARRFSRIRKGVIAAMAAMIVLLAFAMNSARQEGRRAATEAQNATRSAEFMAGLFASAQPNNAEGRDVTVREVLDIGRDSLLAGAMSDVPEVRARAMQDLANTYFSLALYDEALELGKASLAIRQNVLLSPDSVLVHSWEFIGRTHSWLQQYDSAAAMLERALDVRRRARDESLFNTLGLLAEARMGQGRTEESRALMAESRALADASMDTTSLEFAAVLYNESTTASRLGDYADALALARRALAVNDANADAPLGARPALLGAIASALGGLAASDTAVAVAEARYREADSLWAEALEIERRIYPEGHDDLAVSLNNRAINALKMHDTAAAVGFMRESRDMYTQVMGADAPTTSVAESNLAEILAHSDATLDEALQLMQEATAKLTRLDPGSMALANGLDNFGIANFTNRRWELAARYLSLAAEVHREGGRPYEQGLSLSILAQAYDSVPDRERAERALRDGINALRASDSIQYLGVQLDMLQDRMYVEGRNDESEEAAREALAVRRSLPEGHLDLVDALADVAWWHAFRGRPDSARTLVTEATALLDADRGIIGDWLVGQRSTLNALIQLDDWNGVTQSYRNRVRRLRERTPTPTPDIVDAWVALALDLANGGRMEEAKAYADSALAAGASLPADDPMLARARRLMDLLNEPAR